MTQPDQPRMKDSQRQLLQALHEIGPMTRIEIERYLGIVASCASRRIQRLYARGLIRIVRYERTTGSVAPVYGPADGQADAPYPGGVGHKERQRKYRERHAVRIAVRRYGTKTRLVGPWAGLPQGASQCD